MLKSPPLVATLSDSMRMSPCSWGDIFTWPLRGDRIIGLRQSKILDCADVGTCGMLSVITTLEFLQHYFAKMGHRNTSCDPHLHPSHQATNAPLPHAKRPPPGGYVQTRKSETWSTGRNLSDLTTHRVLAK